MQGKILVALAVILPIFITGPVALAVWIWRRYARP